jgi:CRP-like cAMP-binding protein
LDVYNIFPFLKDISVPIPVQHFEKHQVIFFEGQAVKHAYAIAWGQVKLYKNGPAGKSQIIKLYKEGTIIGLDELLFEGCHSTNAETLAPTECIRIDKIPFIGWLDQHPDYVREMLRQSHTELRLAYDSICSLAQKTVTQRIAEALLYLRNFHGHANGHPITISLTREELSELTGTVLETTVRCLSFFKANGYILLDKKNLVILNENALKQIAFELTAPPPNPQR